MPAYGATDLMASGRCSPPIKDSQKRGEAATLSCYPLDRSGAGKSMKKKAVYLALLVLAVLHQDFWFWDDSTLLFGFLPVGLAYHAVYSLVAALLWYLALVFAWPSDAEAFAEQGPEETAGE